MKTAGAEAEAYRCITDLVHRRCGILLHRGKEALIKARLGKRMRQLGIMNLTEYCRHVQTSPDESEVQFVIDALTTNFTTFFREEAHFRFLVERGLPSVLPPGVKRFEIWSAACASGEEPYTLAMYLSEFFPPALGWGWRITASDISTKVLRQARTGIYTAEKLNAVPPDWLRKYFRKGTGQWEGHYQVKPSLAERIDFREINLIESYRHPQSYEAIFCRNMMIYLDRPTQIPLVHQICSFLKPGGYLIVGHAESLNGIGAELHCVKPSIYRKGPP